MSRYNDDGTLDWDNMQNGAVYWALLRNYQVQSWGCWEAHDNPTSEGLIWHTTNNSYDVRYVYCFNGERNVVCVNPDHIDKGGQYLDGPNIAQDNEITEAFIIDCLRTMGWL